VQLLRGEIARDSYVAAMQKLILAIKADVRLAPVAAAMNEARLLLEDERAPAPEPAPLVGVSMSQEHES
jgi:hypothetical protein